MKHTNRSNRANRWSLALRFTSVGLCLVLVFGVLGCPPGPMTDGNANGDDNANDNSATGTISGEIISLKQNFQSSSLDPPFSVQYSVSGPVEEVSAFYEPVADGTVGSEPTGDAVVFATGLIAGSMQAFTFDPQIVDVGWYRLGILVTSTSGAQVSIMSKGAVQVQGPPSPVFIQPAQALVEIPFGGSQTVSFDAGDPENQVQWRVFYLSGGADPNASPEVLGTSLGTGSGNAGQVLFNAEGLLAGDYQLGVSATDSGSSISTTVADGETSKIVTVFGPIIRVLDAEPVPTPPTLVFTNPGNDDVSLFLDETFTIQFQGQVPTPGATGTIDIFYDTDTDVSNGFFSIAEGLNALVTAVQFPEGVAEGTYNIGGTIRDGINAPVTTYASGQVEVIRTVELTVNEPSVNKTIAPSSGDEVDTAMVSWTTNVPAGSGTIDVFAKAVNSVDQPFGSEIPILTGADTSTTSAEFSSEDSGIFAMFVRVNFGEGDEADSLEVEADGRVLVSSLPRILYVGELSQNNPTFDGAIFEGVNFEDNAGTNFAAPGDIDGDGFDDFVISARYGKPYFTNPTGVGPGEAYLIYGKASKYSGTFNLNTVGTSTLPGVTFTGIRTPQASNETDGLRAVEAIPDLDGDGRSELMFGFPHTESRGHNVDFRQDGVFDVDALCSLEREDQFLNGGLVIVSSKNSAIMAPAATPSPVINLDLVGQDFIVTNVIREPEDDEEDDWFDDRLSFNENEGCMGSCLDPSSGDGIDTAINMDFGFNSTLAKDYITQWWLTGCSLPSTFDPGCGLLYCDESGLYLTEPASPLLSNGAGLTGMYPEMLAGDDEDDTIFENAALEPFGARIIGIGPDDDFGASTALIDSTSGVPQIIVSAPDRTARGILFGFNDENPPLGGEINGLVSSGGTPAERSNSGVAYLFDLRNLWENDGSGRPPRPHQYMVGQPSHIGRDIDEPGTSIVEIKPNIDAIRIAGQTGERIRNIVGLGDFNADSRGDFAIGAPEADGGSGRVYICYRRAAGVEDDYVLEKLANAPSDPDRLDGVLIISDSTSALGTSLASGVDFNHDGLDDLVIGAPNADAGIGEVIVVFGDPDGLLVSPEGGITVEGLLATGRAVRIEGNPLDIGGQFGFNVANGGDIDGDGFDDLLISAPQATPRFDPDPSDGIDELVQEGVDVNGDGIQDDVSGPLGLPDGFPNAAAPTPSPSDNLTAAGLVYVVFGKNDLSNLPGNVISIDQLGAGNLRGLMIAGRRADDLLGGGDAGDVAQGGINEKANRGRSFGLHRAGDIDGDGRDDILIGSILADPRIDPTSGDGVANGGEAYLIYGSVAP